MWTNDSFSREPHLELWWIKRAVNHKQKPYPPKRGQRFGSIARIGGCRLCWWGDFKRSNWFRVELTRGVPLPAWEKRQGHWERMMVHRPVEPWFGVLWPLEVLWSLLVKRTHCFCVSHDNSTCATRSHNLTFTENGTFPWIIRQLNPLSIPPASKWNNENTWNVCTSVSHRKLTVVWKWNTILKIILNSFLRYQQCCYISVLNICLSSQIRHVSSSPSPLPVLQIKPWV